MVGGLRVALGTDDLLELALELGPLEARQAGDEVVRELDGSRRIELPVKEILDLDKNLFAANL